jgi:hypothetical protein
VGSLNGRVRRLEARERERPPARSRTQQEIWAIDAEIGKLETEMRTEGMDGGECLRGVSVDLPLDEHIAMLGEELDECRED